MSSKRLLLTSITLLLLFMVRPAGSVEITTQGLRETEDKIKKLVRESLPATVALEPQDKRGRTGTGTGIIVSEDGLILTAAHVSMVMNGKVTVIFPDGHRVKGKVLGMDYSRDSSMIQITEPGKYPYVKLGDSKSLEINDWCIALGHAGGFQPNRKPPVRLGRILKNNPKTYLRTDSALVSGDSGGPLFDINGKLIGIHSNIGSDIWVNNHVPIATYFENWDKLKSGERFGAELPDAVLDPHLPAMGARLNDVPNQSGALIGFIIKGSPAEKAGLKKGDIITKAQGFPVANSKELVAQIHRLSIGDNLRISVSSQGKKKNLRVRLTSLRKLKRNQKRTPEEAKALQDDFNEVLRRSIKDRILYLTQDDYEKFRSKEEFNAFMKRFQATLNPHELKILDHIASQTVEAIRPASHDPDKSVPVAEDFFRSVLHSFRPSGTKASDATHPVFRGQEWKSMCTVIHKDGYAVTKYSEIEAKNNQKLNVLLAKGKLVSARIVRQWRDHDLALLKLNTSKPLAALDLNGPTNSLPPGSMISAPGSGPDPMAIGLISVPSRSLSGATKGFLGVGTYPDEKGVRVTQAREGSSAYRAGISRGDIITKIGGAVCDTPDKLIKEISSRSPGTDVVIQLLRKGRGMSVKVTLGSRRLEDERIPDPSGKMNAMGTDVSSKSTGFPNIIQTDLPIKPEQCGGPVVDLDGNLVGINIARAGRIKTYMIPKAEISRLVSPSLPILTRPAL